MCDRHNLYLKTGVLLLANVFERFCRVSIGNYGLDPCLYYSAPGLSWYTLLTFIKIELELLTNVDLFNFIERGNRVITKTLMRKQDIYKIITKIFRLIIFYPNWNNLYGYAMSEPMPYGAFHWIAPDHL